MADSKKFSENGIKEIRYLCDEALDHQMGWKNFCEMVRHRLAIETTFIQMASSPNAAGERLPAKTL